MQPNGERPVVISFRLEHLLGWGITIFLCLLPAFFWLHLHPLVNIHTSTQIFLSLGRVTGLIGMIMYSLNLLYATRLRFLEFLFGGLNRVYIAHHMLGGFALIFLSLHPLFLALSYVKASLQHAALLLLPNGLAPVSALFNTHAVLHQVILNQWALFLGIIAFWGMVVLLLVTFFIRIPYRIWLLTHKFLGAVFFIGGLHVLFIASDTSQNGPLKYYILGMTALGLLAFAYKTLVGKVLIKKYRYSVTEVVQSGGNVTQIKMHPVKRAMHYAPGQFVFIRFLDAKKDDVTSEWHPFTISSSPNEDFLQVSIKGLGDYTNTLGKLRNGTIAEIEGAYGRFSFKHYKNKNQIWIGGGIGITPFISMAKSLPQDSSVHVDLYYAVKSESELIDWNALAGIANGRNGDFRIIPYVGDKMPGHLSADYIEQVSGGVAGKDFYICGPPSMMQSLRKQLRAKSVPGTSIHSEEFGMS